MPYAQSTNGADWIWCLCDGSEPQGSRYGLDCAICGHHVGESFAKERERLRASGDAGAFARLIEMGWFKYRQSMAETTADV